LLFGAEENHAKNRENSIEEGKTFGPKVPEIANFANCVSPDVVGCSFLSATAFESGSTLSCIEDGIFVECSSLSWTVERADALARCIRTYA
jgi:hypothetical protein